MKGKPQPQVTLPHSHNDEQAIIGGCLIADAGNAQNRSMIGYALANLSDADFIDPRAKVAFVIIRHLQSIKARKPEFQIDIIVAVSLLRKHNRLADCTPAYLAACIESCPSVANMAAYVENVRECAAQRKLIKLAETLTQVLTVECDRDFYAGQLISTTREALDAIESGKVFDFNELRPKRENVVY